MRTWNATILRNLETVARPVGYPHAHATGIDSDRVLLFGSGAAVGWGVLTHDLALPGTLARALSAATGRGTDVDVVADGALTAGGAIAALRDLRLWKYDAIVITLGLNEVVGLDSLTTWRRDFNALLEHLTREKSQTCDLFVLGVHAVTRITPFDAVVARIAQEHRSALNRVTLHLCRVRERATFVAFNPGRSRLGHRYRETNEYRSAAAVLASQIGPALDRGWHAGGGGAFTRRDIATTDNESDRQNAVDALQIFHTMPEPDFDRIVGFARQAFGAASAAFTIIDHDRQWEKASAGTLSREVPRVDSFCTRTIEETGPMIVGDAATDPRFRESPLVVGEPHIRFYAGFPIESPSGERIGALCVFDPAPRRPDTVDASLLRDLAIMVQKNIWYRTAT